ncbi:MAG: Mur ligase domain-containing protein [bacterium]|nr:Mur ligase domain-containing protein [bacterium]
MHEKIHFVGIGGIGVSSLARYYLAKGARLSGSDLTESDLVRELIAEGVIMRIGHHSDNLLRDVSRVVYSAAAKEDNPELKEARRRGLPCMTYAEALGELTKQYITIGVSGAHGKSTTTALLSLMLVHAGLDPTVIIGTRLAEFGGKNVRIGKSRYLVIEADEWNKSFFHYAPQVAIITNVDAEHLDTYKNLAGVIKAFNKYVTGLPKEATVVVNAQDKNTITAIKGCKRTVVKFNEKGKRMPKWPLEVAGQFNQLNAEAAYRAAAVLGVTRKDAAVAVGKFKGSWRRMEPLTPRENNKIFGTFFADYAHHPTEIAATIGAFKTKFRGRKLFVIFQPHQVARLTALFPAFVKAFEGTDQVAILPAYQVAGREVTGGKTSEDLYKGIVKLRGKSAEGTVFYLKNIAESLNLIDKQVVVFMGAGTIDAETRHYFVSQLLPM